MENVLWECFNCVSSVIEPGNNEHEADVAADVWDDATHVIETLWFLRLVFVHIFMCSIRL